MRAIARWPAFESDPALCGSVTRAEPSVLAAKVCSSYPLLEESGAIDDILPKKESITVAKLYAYASPLQIGRKRVLETHTHRRLVPPLLSGFSQLQR